MAFIGAILVLGCKPSLPPSKPIANLTPQEISGYHTYQTHCVACHYANTDGSLHGPSLHGLYKKPYLPSGAPANDHRIVSVILHGRNLMPALGSTLDDQQLTGLLAYLRTL